MILPILLCTNSDAEQAEALLDWLAVLKNKQPSGHLLIACQSIHEETQMKLRVAAEIGFSNVELIAFPKPEPEPAKPEGVNIFYQKVAKHIYQNFKWPWLALEPDCVCKPGWLEALSDAYDASPKSVLGSILADKDGKRCIGRVCVYPPTMFRDISQLFPSGIGAVPFEIAAGESLVSRCEKSRLIQVAPTFSTEDLARIRPDAILVHGDKNGILLKKLREEFKPTTNAELISPGLVVPDPTGEPRPEVPLSAPLPATSLPAPRLDGRTRAGRLLRLEAQKQAEL